MLSAKAQASRQSKSSPYPSALSMKLTSSRPVTWAEALKVLAEVPLVMPFLYA